MLPRVPFLGFVLFFISGIVLCNYLPESITTIANVTFLMVCLTAITLYFYFKKQNLGIGISVSFFIVASGILATALQNDRLNFDLRSLSVSNYSAYELTVKSLPEKRTKTIRIEAVVDKVQRKGEWKNQHIKALVSIPLDASVIPKPGDHIVVKGNLERPSKALNPEEFDYRSYLWNKGIVWTDYLQEGSYSVLPTESQPYGLGSWSTSISEWADRTFRSNIENDESYGLVKAMLLGRRDDLRSTQVDDYTTSGTVHILSVSGMHVAIIFLALSLALGWMKRWRLGKFVYLITVTALLCFYALVTGLPPSVQRATLMCIVFIISEAFSRKQSSINTLAITALLILIVDPHALYDVGFQLSFLAMAGIFLLYEPIELIWQPKNFALKYIWQITAMSFAAQLATFPLSLYYFHQFPFYFWLVNPFVILFTNVLLPASMVLLIFSIFSITWLQYLINGLVELSAYFTNISVSVPKKLPGYFIENLYLDRIEVILLYVFIFAIWLGYSKQEYIVIKRAFVVVILFVFYSFSRSVQTYLSSKAIIHSVPKHSVISFKEGSRLYLSCDPAFLTDTNAYEFRIKNYAIRQGISDIVYLSDKQNISSKSINVINTNKGRFITWKRNIIWHGSFLPSLTGINYNLVNKGITPKQGQVLTAGKSTFLIGGEIRGKKLEKWKDYLTSSKVKFHDLADGYLLLH